MNKKIFIYVAIIILTVSFSFAFGAASSSSSSSGGGGGGGGGGSSGGSAGFGTGSSGITPSGSHSSSGDGPYLYGLKCLDTGQLTFKQSPPLKPVMVEKENGTNLTINGEWEGTAFTSEEAEIKETGNYTLHDPKNGDREVECPGLKFSCKLVSLKIKECSYEEQKFSARFTLTGKSVSIDEVEFKFQRRNSSQLLEYQKNTVASSELKNVSIKSNGNDTYQLDTEGNFSTLEITYPRCIGRYYVYDKKECPERKRLQDKVEKLVNKDYHQSISNTKDTNHEGQKWTILDKIILLLKNLLY